MKLFYIECEDKNEEDVLNELINNSYSKELTQNVYMINPKLNKNQVNKLATKLTVCDNYSVYESMLYYLNDNTYNEEIKVDSMYNIEFGLEISEVLKEIMFRDEHIFDDDNIIYDSENPWEMVWERLDIFGRRLLKERLDDLINNLKVARFNRN